MSRQQFYELRILVSCVELLHLIIRSDSRSQGIYACQHSHHALCIVAHNDNSTCWTILSIHLHVPHEEVL